MNVAMLNRDGRSAKRFQKQRSRLVGEMAGAGERLAERAAQTSERTLKTATKAAEQSLSDLVEAASDLYDERRGDAEEMLREAGKTVGTALTAAASNLVAMLPSERRRRRRRRGLFALGAVIIGVLAYRLWFTRAGQPSDDSGADTRLDGTVSDINRTTSTGI